MPLSKAEQEERYVARLKAARRLPLPMQARAAIISGLEAAFQVRMRNRQFQYVHNYRHPQDLIRDMANPEHRKTINPDSFLAIRDVIAVGGDSLIMTDEERDAIDMAVALLEAIALSWDPVVVPSKREAMAPGEAGREERNAQRLAPARRLSGQARAAIIGGLEAAFNVYVGNRLFHYVDDYRHPKNLIRDMGNPELRGPDSLVTFKNWMWVDFDDLEVSHREREDIGLAVAVLEAITLRWD